MWVLKSTESREEKNVGESERIEGWKKWWKRNWEKGWKPFFRCFNRFMVFSFGFFSDVFFPIGFLWAVFFQCISIFMGISMLSYSWYFEVKKLLGWFFFILIYFFFVLLLWNSQSISTPHTLWYFDVAHNYHVCVLLIYFLWVVVAVVIVVYSEHLSSWTNCCWAFSIDDMKEKIWFFFSKILLKGYEFLRCKEIRNYG